MSQVPHGRVHATTTILDTTTDIRTTIVPSLAEAATRVMIGSTVSDVIAGDVPVAPRRTLVVGTTTTIRTTTTITTEITIGITIGNGRNPADQVAANIVVPSRDIHPGHKPRVPPLLDPVLARMRVVEQNIAGHMTMKIVTGENRIIESRIITEVLSAGPRAVLAVAVIQAVTVHQVTPTH